MLSEAETLIYTVKSVTSMMNMIVFSSRDYIAFNYLPQIINNVKKFCVHGNSILRVASTFELIDGLWLTDTTYTNEALLDSQGKHPEFPGPSMWHFRKDRQCYRRFAAELVMVEPELKNIKKIGHDLDQAIPNALIDIIPDARRIWCTQHLQERDAHQLKEMGANQKNRDRIMADLYGSQRDILLESGLVDSYDEADFNVKLVSLAHIWDNLVPGFHEWFSKNRKVLFCESVVLSALQELGIEDRFYKMGLS